MSLKDLFSKNSNFTTIIGSTVNVGGDLSADGYTRIDGKVNGNVKVYGDLVMGETAVVTGNVTADSLRLEGTIEGNVNCKNDLWLGPKSKLLGDIRVRKFAVEEGAQYQGIVSMSDVEK